MQADGREIAVWDGGSWHSGGFTLDGQRYQMRGNLWGTQYTLTSADGTPLAVADGVSRKHWTVEAAGQVYRFQRKSLWSSDQELLGEHGPVGSVRRTSMWRSDVTADLPGLPPPVAVFVVGVVITMLNAEAGSGT
ncbi:hypothetical protein KRMM14A1004_46170 [Krasilnikovia sp. MM14-A1004]